MNGVIYKITNKVNGKIYIGQTIKDVKERFYQHCARITGEAVLNMAIHRAIFKYGKENFTLEVLETIDSSLLNEREQYWISHFDSYNNGYNSTEGGQGGFKPFKDLDDEGIIKQYKEGKSFREIGRMFNVDKDTVKQLLIRHNIALRTTRTYKFSQDDRIKMMQDYNSGMSRKDIQAKWKVSHSYLAELINGQRRI